MLSVFVSCTDEFYPDDHGPRWLKESKYNQTVELMSLLATVLPEQMKDIAQNLDLIQKAGEPYRINPKLIRAFRYLPAAADFEITVLHAPKPNSRKQTWQALQGIKSSLQKWVYTQDYVITCRVDFPNSGDCFRVSSLVTNSDQQDIVTSST